MEKEITITYRWWRDDNKPISNEEQEHLERKALFHIKDMWRQGYTNGQLIDYPKFTGHWELSTKTIK